MCVEKKDLHRVRCRHHLGDVRLDCLHDVHGVRSQLHGSARACVGRSILTRPRVPRSSVPLASLLRPSAVNERLGANRCGENASARLKCELKEWVYSKESTVKGVRYRVLVSVVVSEGVQLSARARRPTQQPNLDAPAPYQRPPCPNAIRSCTDTSNTKTCAVQRIRACRRSWHAEYGGQVYQLTLSYVT